MGPGGAPLRRGPRVYETEVGTRKLGWPEARGVSGSGRGRVHSFIRLRFTELAWCARHWRSAVSKPEQVPTATELKVSS